MAGKVSQNGWPVSPPRRARQIGNRGAKVTVADGPAGDVLVHVCTQIDLRVEDIDLKSTRGEYDDWGYADRNVRGSSDTSNHASATAVDVNATRHPLGKVGTFDARQVIEIHRILREVDNVVRWGGDYVGRRDEMHFEIVGTPDEVARVAARLRGKPVPAPQQPTKEDDVGHVDTISKTAADAIASAIVNRRMPEDFGQPSLVARRVWQRGNSLSAAVLVELRAQRAVIDRLVAALTSGGQVTGNDVRTAIREELAKVAAEGIDVNVSLDTADPGDTED